MKTRWTPIVLIMILATLLLLGCAWLLNPPTAQVAGPVAAPRYVGSCTTYSSTGGSITIPDGNLAGITSTITIPPVSGKVTALRLSIGLDHPYPQDLRAYLSTPNLCYAEIFSNQLDAQSFTGSIRFANDGIHKIDFTDYPYGGLYQPNVTLPTNYRRGGRWKLHVIDSSDASDEGDLTGWSVTVCTDGATPEPVETPTAGPTGTATPTPIPTGVYLFDNESYGACADKFAAGEPTVGPDGTLHIYDSSTGRSAYVPILICNVLNANLNVVMSGSASASRVTFPFLTPAPMPYAAVSYYYIDYIDPGLSDGNGYTSNGFDISSTCESDAWGTMDIYYRSSSFSESYALFPWHQKSSGADFNSYANDANAASGNVYCLSDPPLRDAVAAMNVQWTPGPTFTPSPTPVLVCGTPNAPGGWVIW